MAKGRIKYPMEPLFTELKKDYCYVCCQRIAENQGIGIGRISGDTKNVNRAVSNGLEAHSTKKINLQVLSAKAKHKLCLSR